MEHGVTICIPTYNGEKYFKKSIESAIHQSYRDIEILIVDDGSQDSTLALAREYGCRYENIRIIKNSSTQGMASNCNECIRQARYSWIKFLFQDDVFRRDCIEKMMQVCLSTGCRFALCRRDFIIEEDADKTTKNYFENRLVKAEKIFKGKVYFTPLQIANEACRYGAENIFGEPSCVLVHKSIVDKIGGFEPTMHQLMDYEFILRCVMLTGMAFIPESLVYFRVHSCSKTASNVDAGISSSDKQTAIRAFAGEQLFLIRKFLHDAHFRLIKEIWGEQELKTALTYLYLKACKRYGEEVTKQALRDLLSITPELSGMKYNLLNYLVVKRRYNNQSAS